VLAMMDPRAQPSRPTLVLFSWPLLPPRSWAIQRPDGSSRDNATVIRGRFCEEQYGALRRDSPMICSPSILIAARIPTCI
jgi:hypothetical protein